MKIFSWYVCALENYKVAHLLKGLYQGIDGLENGLKCSVSITNFCMCNMQYCVKNCR